MKKYKGLSIVLLVAMLAAMLPGCAAPTPEVIKETVEVPVEVTRVVEKEVPGVAAGEAVYEVVYPLERFAGELVPLVPRLDTLEGKTICELTQDMFGAEITFPEIRKLLSEQYPGIKVVLNTELPDTWGKRVPEKDLPELIPKALAEKGCDAVISGNGG